MHHHAGRPRPAGRETIQNMNRDFEELQRSLEKASALQAALSLFSWDSETLAPPESAAYTARAVGALAEEYSAVMNSPRLRELAASIDPATLSPKETAILRHLRRDLEYFEKIPQEEYRAWQELLARSSSVWKAAKAKNDFASFAPVLEEIVQTARRFAKLRAKPGQAPYDVLLQDYDESFPMAVLDPFFEKVKNCVVPLLRARVDALHEQTVKHPCPADRQRAFCRWLAGYVGLDFSRGVMGETEHPFTDGLHNHDVRIALHYHEDDAASAIFATIHETGHAIYEQQIDDDYTLTLAGEVPSMALHESQSRFFENNIGRSRPFWTAIYEKLQHMLPEAYGDVSLDEFLREANAAVPGPLRLEADELTYSLHILIRYELEKQLIDGSLAVKDLPGAWNARYRELLGVEVHTDSEGVLSDSHWSGGLIGYFPSYAIGSAFAAQLEARLRSVMDLDGALRSGGLSDVRAYLREHLHRFGGVKTSAELIESAAGEPFNPDYYLEYLTKKYKL